MTDSLLLNVYVAQARAQYEALERWDSEHVGMPTAQELEEILDLCLSLPRQMERLYESERKRAVTTPALGAAALQALRRELQEGCRRALLAFEWLQRTGERLAQETGTAVKALPALPGAIERMNVLLARIGKEWPVASPEELAEARAAAARGEGQDLADAFAEMTGRSCEQWLAHVEEYKRRQARQTHSEG